MKKSRYPRYCKIHIMAWYNTGFYYQTGISPTPSVCVRDGTPTVKPGDALREVFVCVCGGGWGCVCVCVCVGCGGVCGLCVGGCCVYLHTKEPLSSLLHGS